MSGKNKGFSLIELMIVVVVVGILGAVAYPNFVRYTQRTHRAEVAELLTEAAQTLERHYSQVGVYTNTGTNDIANPASNAYYTVTTLRNVQDFTLTATPIAGGLMATDACGALTLTNTGLRSITGTTVTLASCWGR